MFFTALHAQQGDTLLIQNNTDADSVINTPGLADTTSLVPSDTTAKRKTYDIDTTIYANATDSLIFFVKKRKMNLYGDGELQYKETDLKSSNIFVDFETSNIEATGTPSDTAGKFIGSPVLSEKGEVYEGIRMKYNFKSAQGIISHAGSKLEGGLYTGEKIKKVTTDTYFIEDGIYTTCDEQPPHYHFYSHEMKVIQKQQIVAKWIWLYFGGVPFPVPLPFAVFPIQSGRRSGILPPAFGTDARFGTYFSRFGYFWAISDYMDVNMTADYYTRGSYNLNSRFRYAERYNFSGFVEGGYRDMQSGELTDRDRLETTDWRLRMGHNQTINPTTRLDINLDFQSTNYNQRSVTLAEALTQNLISNANLSKTWEESGNSMSIGYSRNQNLRSGDIYEVLPNVSFNMSQKFPFRKEGVSNDPAWYEQFGYSYNGQFRNKRDKIKGDLDVRGGFLHDIRANFSPKIGYFNFTPSINYQEKWYNKKIEKYRSISEKTGADTVLTRDIHQINQVRTFGMGVSTQTRFYGIYDPHVLGISSVRHTVNPSISYNYTPDFGKPGWGYFSSYRDSTGREIKYSKFEKEVFGGTSTGESQSISFSLANIFEMKTEVDPTDTTSKERKIQLLNLSANMNYNFAADSIKLSDLNISYRTQIGDILSLSGSSNFTPYDFAGRTKINKLLVNEGRGLFRMTNVSFSLSTSLSGERLKSASDNQNQGEGDLQSPEYNLANADRRTYRGIYEDRQPDFSIPWDVNFSYNYSLSKPNPVDKPSIFSNLQGTINFNLTPAWKFSLTGSYDFQNKEFAAPQVIISRDLHCWLMNFTWNPIGTYRGYRLEIKVKAPQLQDLKITKRSDFFSGGY